MNTKTRNRNQETQLKIKRDLIRAEHEKLYPGIAEYYRMSHNDIVEALELHYNWPTPSSKI